MEESGIGAGLAALAFWGFVSAAVLGGIWDGIRKRDAQQETLRRIVESGKTLDEAMIERIMQQSRQTDSRPDRDLKLTAFWILPVAPGLAALGLILGTQVDEARIPILAASALVLCLGIGFYIASGIVARWYMDDTQGSPGQVRD